MKQWTVKQKLSTLIVSVVLAFGVLTAALLTRIAAASGEMQSLYEQDYKVSGLVGQIDGLLTRVDINILRMVAIGDPASIAQWKAQNTERFTQADKLLAELRPLADTSVQATVNQLTESYAKLRTGMENQVKAIESGDMKLAGDINRQQVKDNADQTFGALASLSQAQATLAKGKVDSRQAAAAATRLSALIAAAVVAFGSLVMGTLLVRNLLRQLGGEPTLAADAVAAMAQGDLAARIVLNPGDDTSLMARLSQMQQSLATLVSGVRANAESVATASAQIAQGNQDLSNRTEEQAGSLQMTAASMTELGATVRQNADNAKLANQLTQGASAVAIKGGEVVSRVVDTMKGINDSSRQIADIISVIDGIAFQTNILALNAAVEAARAGEQGRGFAVVASEVRSLAQRSAEAAKQIKGLITASVERVEQGSTLVDQAGATMTEIVDSIRRVTDLMGEISAASTEQNNGVSQVGNAVTQMDHATQQNAALVEESAAAADSLKQQAQQLVQGVAVFRLTQAA